MRRAIERARHTATMLLEVAAIILLGVPLGILVGIVCSLVLASIEVKHWWLERKRDRLLANAAKAYRPN